MPEQTRVVIPRRNLNALRPGGPRTEEGKAISSRNSLKHGLTARQTVIPGEDPAEFELLLEDLTAERRPIGELELQLTGEIAACLWRLARARQREADLLETCGDLFTTNHNHADFDRLLRYMGAIERQLNKAIVRLDQLQAARRKQEKHQPAATTPGPIEAPRVLTATASAPLSTTMPEFVLSQPKSAPPATSEPSSEPAPQRLAS